MNHSFTRRFAVRWAVVVASCVLSCSISAAPPDKTVKDVPDERAGVSPKILEFLKPLDLADDDDELVRKMKEKHNVAVKLLDARVEQYKRSIGSLDIVLDAARAVVDSKLDLATDRPAQLAVYENSLEIAQLIEQHHKTLVEEGIGTTSDLLRAQLARVSIEVQILKFKKG